MVSYSLRSLCVAFHALAMFTCRARTHTLPYLRIWHRPFGLPVIIPTRELRVYLTLRLCSEHRMRCALR